MRVQQLNSREAKFHDWMSLYSLILILYITIPEHMHSLPEPVDTKQTVFHLVRVVSTIVNVVAVPGQSFYHGDIEGYREEVRGKEEEG